MLYDYEQYSGFEQDYDELGVLAGDENKGMRIRSEVFNVIMAEGLAGIIVDDVGGKCIICVKAGGMSKIHGMTLETTEAIYQNIQTTKKDKCKVKFRAQAQALVRKVPGFPTITGYKFAQHITPATLVTMQ